MTPACYFVLCCHITAVRIVNLPSPDAACRCCRPPSDTLAQMPHQSQGPDKHVRRALPCTPPSTPQLFKHKEFNFEKLGIGGLDNQFEQIFRRAFASRVFPPSVVERLGIRHVRGVLLFGPPGARAGGEGAAVRGLLCSGVRVLPAECPQLLGPGSASAGVKWWWHCTWRFGPARKVVHGTLPPSNPCCRHGQDADCAPDRQDAQRQGAQDCERAGSAEQVSVESCAANLL